MQRTALAMVVPFAVEPKEVPLIWGGHALVRRFHKPGDPSAAIGESWECWDDNAARGGPYAGTPIAGLREQLGDAFLGALDPARPFPILTKFIDASQPLSVQVHPGDAYAQRVEHQPNGKTECWLILDAEPGAELILGWTRDTSRDEYVRRVADGTLGDVLRRVPVRPGDVFYLPAGTVHSIGAGIVLYETQQTSDLTYRIFDWNRLGPDGKPRQLHVDKAADVLDYRATDPSALDALQYLTPGVKHAALVADHLFLLERVEVAAEPGALSLGGVPLVVTALQTALTLEAGGTTLQLGPYDTALVPAALGSVILASKDGAAGALTVAPLLSADAAARRLEPAGPPPQVAAFLRQFAP